MKKKTVPPRKARRAPAAPKVLRVYLRNSFTREAYCQDVPVLAEFRHFGERFVVTPLILMGGGLSQEHYAVTHAETGAKVWFSSSKISEAIAEVKAKLSEAGKAVFLKGKRKCMAENRRRMKEVRGAKRPEALPRVPKSSSKKGSVQ